ncbi:MAG: hypothetical protein ACFE0Q_18765 [Anaerolineae bacterium]
MPDRYQESHIRRIPIFSELPSDQFQLVAQAFEARTYDPGTYVLIQNSELPGMIIIATGQLLAIKMAPDGVATRDNIFYDGQFLYQNALFESVRAETHLQAIRPTTLLWLTRDRLLQLVAHYPDLKYSFGFEEKQAHHVSDTIFKTQRENENILLKTRQHWFSIMHRMLIPILIILLGLWASSALPALAVVTVPLIFIIGFVAVAYVLIEWLNDAVIITDQRIVRITHTILTFHEVRNEVALESIQEVNAEIPIFDLFARIFRYGDVEIKTAGAQGNFTLALLPDPEGLQELILEDAQNYRARKQVRERETMRAELDRWIEEPFLQRQASDNSDSDKKSVSEDKIQSIYNPGEGPASPFVMSFPTHDGGIVYRKHWFVWMRSIITPTLITLLSLTAMGLLALTPLGNVGGVGWASAFVTLLIGVVWFYVADWDWRHDYYMITDNNITIINQRPFWLQNESDQVLLKQVDNVVAETRGVLQQIFKYGDVRVALVGADTQKLFDNVPNPIDVQSEITRRQQRLKQRHTEEQERIQRETIGEYISLYHQSHQQGQNAPNQAQAQPQERQNSPNNQPSDLPNPPQPSPFGQRPSISSGRPYTPTSQPPPYQGQGRQAPTQSPYHSNQPPQQGQGGQQPPRPNQAPPYQQGEGGQQPAPPRSPYRPNQARSESNLPPRYPDDRDR